MADSMEMKSLTRREALAAGAGMAWQGGMKVIDAHNHCAHHSNRNWAESDRRLIEAADRLGIDALCCSIVPVERPTTVEGCRQSNEWMAEAARRYRGRVLPYCFVNPTHGEAALEMARRYVEREGFIGLKLYNDVLVTDDVVRPLLEFAARLRVPVLHHAGHVSWLGTPQPHISDAGHIAEAARRYPEVPLICAHFCGGGDWEWSLKALRDAPTAYFDSSGSVADEGTVEFAVRTLGAGRVLFATDLSFTASVGRVRGAQIAEADRRLIMGANMKKILEMRRA